MNLADGLAALTDYLMDRLDGCGRAVCAAYRYHGFAEPVPGAAGSCDCTCEETSDLVGEQEEGMPQGVLRVSWTIIGPSASPPSLGRVWATTPGKPLVEVKARVLRCWPTEKATVLEMDAAAAGLADDAWCLVCSAQDLINCATPTARTAVGLGMCGGIGGYTIEPVLPSGGCAGTMLSLSLSMSGSCV